MKKILFLRSLSITGSLIMMSCASHPLALHSESTSGRFLASDTPTPEFAPDCIEDLAKTPNAWVKSKAKGFIGKMTEYSAEKHGIIANWNGSWDGNPSPELWGVELAQVVPPVKPECWPNQIVNTHDVLLTSPGGGVAFGKIYAVFADGTAVGYWDRARDGNGNTEWVDPVRFMHGRTEKTIRGEKDGDPVQAAADFESDQIFSGKILRSFTDDLLEVQFDDGTQKIIPGSNIPSVDRAAAKNITLMIEGKNYHLIREILTLSNGSTLPEGIITKYDSRLIAASIIQRFHAIREWRDGVSNPDYDYRSGTLIQMRFPESVIESIKKYGFENEHQIGKGWGDLDRRLHQEETEIGLVIQRSYSVGHKNPYNRVRPKYSFLGFPNEGPDKTKWSKLTSEYGGIIAVFSDELKNRSTFSPDDSYTTVGKDLHTFDYRSKLPLARPPNPTSNDEYWEVQTWGEVTLSDVQYFLVNCTGEKEISAEGLKSLTSIGLPIFKCESVEDRSHFGKGKQIQPGNPSQAPGPAALKGSENASLLVN